MADAIKNLWASAIVRGVVMLGALGFAPFALLSLAVSAIQDKG